MIRKIYELECDECGDCECFEGNRKDAL